MKYKGFFNPHSKYEIIEETEDGLYCKEKENNKVDYEQNFGANYLASNKEFSLTDEDFNSCPFKDKIFKNYNIDFIIVTGSYSYKAFDNVSDYDIDVFVSDTTIINHDDSECLFYKGRKLHWYYGTIDKLINEDTFDSKILLMETHFLKPEFIIYNKVSNNILLENKDKFSQLGILKFIKNIDLNLNGTGCYLYLCYCILNNCEIDKEFLLKIKRMLYIQPLVNDMDKMLEILKGLYEYRYSIAFDEEIFKLKNYLLERVYNDR